MLCYGWSVVSSYRTALTGDLENHSSKALLEETLVLLPVFGFSCVASSCWLLDGEPVPRGWVPHSQPCYAGQEFGLISLWTCRPRTSDVLCTGASTPQDPSYLRSLHPAAGGPCLVGPPGIASAMKTQFSRHSPSRAPLLGFLMLKIL